MTYRGARPLVLAVLVLSLVAGCTTDGRDAGGSSSRATTTVAAATSTVRAASSTARELDGIAYPVWEPDAYAGGEVTTGLADIAALGARTVTIIPTWYVDDRSTSLPHVDAEQTPTDDSLRAAIAEAHRVGLRVLLKPHVDLVDDGDRAEIVPADPAVWFGRYREMMLRYARLAEATGVEMLSVGTELAGTMAFPEEWSTTIAAIKGVYRGPLTYAANFDSYADVPFWTQLDDIGIDAYFELVRTPTTDVDALVAAWQPVLDEIGSWAEGIGRPVVFTEAGFVSQRGSTTQPWNWEISATRADDEQAAGYAALLRAVAARPWIVGVQWWMWDDLADAGEDQSLDYTPHGKEAEQVLRREWSR